MESKTFNSLEDFQNQFDNIGKEEQVQVGVIKLFTLQKSVTRQFNYF